MFQGVDDLWTSPLSTTYARSSLDHRLLISTAQPNLCVTCQTHTSKYRHMYSSIKLKTAAREHKANEVESAGETRVQRHVCWCRLVNGSPELYSYEEAATEGVVLEQRVDGDDTVARKCPFDKCTIDAVERCLVGSAV